MQKRILLAGAVVMTAAILLLLAGAFPVPGGQATVVFRTPVFLLVAALGAGLLLAACFLRRPPLRQAAFALVHAGLVLVMAGAVLDWLREQRIENVRLPVGMGHAIGRLRDAAGAGIDLGFTIEVRDFSVNLYDPVYSLFRPDPSAPDGLAFVRKVDPRVPSTLCNLPGGGLAVDNLQSGGGWRDDVSLPDGWRLRKQAEVPSSYEADVQTVANGVPRSWRLAVNHPVVLNGWQILLVSYGNEPMPVVELTFKRSPGRPLVVAGIWCVIAGVSLLCLVLPLLRKESHAQP